MQFNKQRLSLHLPSLILMRLHCTVQGYRLGLIIEAKEVRKPAYQAAIATGRTVQISGDPTLVNQCVNHYHHIHDKTLYKSTLRL